MPTDHVAPVPRRARACPRTARSRRSPETKHRSPDSRTAACGRPGPCRRLQPATPADSRAGRAASPPLWAGRSSLMCRARRPTGRPRRSAAAARHRGVAAQESRRRGGARPDRGPRLETPLRHLLPQSRGGGLAAMPWQQPPPGSRNPQVGMPAARRGAPDPSARSSRWP